ncbi:phosphodiester glycosidase family protein [Kribbella sp. NPDC058245]|uniref:phosphodiester glycosidase family protein n=1 Tax=Kribbella sp. NPDC058245 TaxID=3346399 RepID=UPI0036E3FB97
MKQNATKRRRRIRKRWIALICCLLLVVPVVSYVRALLYPGSATFAVRTVEWLRDHGGGKIIDTIETWKYTHQQPPSTGVPADVTTAAPPARPSNLPTVQLLPGTAALPHEGAWTVARRTASGKPLLWATWFRPDPAHLPVSVGAAVIPQSGTRLVLMPGTREPVVGMSSANGYSVPAADRSKLIATFNAGFKMKDSHGGWWTTGNAAVPLVDGRASVVIHRDGTAQVGVWGQNLRMSADVVAVRQNLDPVIVDGKIVDGLTANANGRWGSVRSQFQYTWRSGLGTDAHGNLTYVAGNGLTLASLANAMHQAGIQQGMELDIHATMVSFDIEQPGRGGVISKRLLQSMNSPADRYLVDDQRDFFYVVTR